MTILVISVGYVYYVWSQRKIKTAEAKRVHPKHAKLSNLLLNLLITKAAVKLASTCEEAKASPLMYISKWKELSIIEGA